MMGSFKHVLPCICLLVSTYASVIYQPMSLSKISDILHSLGPNRFSIAAHSEALMDLGWASEEEMEWTRITEDMKRDTRVEFVLVNNDMMPTSCGGGLSPMSNSRWVQACIKLVVANCTSVADLTKCFDHETYNRTNKTNKIPRCCGNNRIGPEWISFYQNGNPFPFQRFVQNEFHRRGVVLPNLNAFSNTALRILANKTNKKNEDLPRNAVIRMLGGIPYPPPSLTQKPETKPEQKTDSVIFFKNIQKKLRKIVNDIDETTSENWHDGWEEQREGLVYYVNYVFQVLGAVYRQVMGQGVMTRTKPITESIYRRCGKVLYLLSESLKSLLKINMRHSVEDALEAVNDMIVAPTIAILGDAPYVGSSSKRGIVSAILWSWEILMCHAWKTKTIQPKLLKFYEAEISYTFEKACNDESVDECEALCIDSADYYSFENAEGVHHDEYESANSFSIFMQQVVDVVDVDQNNLDADELKWLKKDPRWKQHFVQSFSDDDEVHTAWVARLKTEHSKSDEHTNKMLKILTTERQCTVDGTVQPALKRLWSEQLGYYIDDANHAKYHPRRFNWKKYWPPFKNRDLIDRRYDGPCHLRTRDFGCNCEDEYQCGCDGEDEWTTC